MAGHMTVKAKLEGGEELIAELKQLGINIRATNRKAAREGAKVWQRDAENRARAISRRGGKSTRITTSAHVGKSVEARVSPSKRKWYLRFAETGTKAGVRVAKKGHFRFWSHGRLIVTKRITHPGTPERPWLRPAFDLNQDAARDAYGAVIAKAIDEKRAQLGGADEE